MALLSLTDISDMEVNTDILCNANTNDFRTLMLSSDMGTYYTIEVDN